MASHPEDTVRGMHFTRDTVAGASHESWRSYNKRAVTRAKRIDGPFSVETREGLLTCRDGYLAIDAHGWPYPIAREEFELIYDETPGPVLDHGGTQSSEPGGEAPHNPDQGAGGRGTDG